MRINSPSKIQGRQTSGPQNKKPKRNLSGRLGKITVVSLGPGDPDYMAPRAKKALIDAQVIVGYRTYMALIEPAILEGKTTISTGMTDEIRRCQLAIERARNGQDTAVVSSGDAGIYGMAGLILELMEEQRLMEQLEVEVIPGIPALSAAAALLGAPLMHDFAAISLSDLLTPWEVIQSRIEASAKADFVLVIYNPRSKKRQWQLGQALDLIRRHRSGQTPVGIVKNAMRKGQSIQITTLSRLDESRVDMLSILVVGNSHTRIAGGKMVTPRGYREKYKTDRPIRDP
jgi:precorrin-3B C17-methyltransferase